MSEHSHPNYVKIWVVLLVLLATSIIGPMFEIPALTLITAFGIALVKAFIVGARFMHLSSEKKYITYLLITGVALLALFFFGVAADIMMHEGQNWMRLPIAGGSH